MQVISALLQQVSPRQLLNNLQDILAKLEGTLTTDIPLSLMARLAANYLSQSEQWEIFSLSLTGTDSTATSYSSSAKAYVMVPDPQAVESISAHIGRLLAGESLSPSYFS